MWDGKDRSLRDDVHALERKIPDDVWIIDPRHVDAPPGPGSVN